MSALAVARAVDPVPTGIYERISKVRPAPGLTAEQDPETLLGVQRQEEAALKLIAEHEPDGWQLVGIYRDNDITAGKPRRGKAKVRTNFERMLTDVRNGVLKLIIVTHPDRLLREPTDLEALIDLVGETGLQIETVHVGRYDLRKSAGQFQARILCAVAKDELNRLSERVRAKYVQLREQGRPGGGVVPYGFHAVNRRHQGRGRSFVINHPEAALIREAANRILVGNESINAIVTDWNSRNLKPRKGKRWSHVALTSILTRASVAGLRGMTTYDKRGHANRLDAIVGEAEWKGILTKDQLMALRHKLVDPANKVLRKPPQRLLTGKDGVLVCGRCRDAFKGWGGGKGRPPQLRCMGCGQSIDRDRTEAVVVATYLERVAGGALTTALREEDDPGVLSELQEVERRLTEMAERYSRGELDMDFVLTARPDLTRQKEALQVRLEAQRRTRNLANVPDPLRPAWFELQVSLQRQLLSLLIKEVVVSPVKAWGRKYDPDRLYFDWRR